MTFYGTGESLLKWQKLLMLELDVPCSDLVVVNGRHSFDVDLNSFQRAFLQEKFWYKAEDDAPLDALDRPMPWNWRVSFSYRARYGGA